uniref:Poly(A) RNA polymerase, mitochondriallike [Acyrthosiphon pisum] n=1 Tax=Lepeophtheirus salmonis TaxID=72036 RepID=A0A0K2SZS3_LEPSM
MFITRFNTGLRYASHRSHRGSRGAAAKDMLLSSVPETRSTLSHVPSRDEKCPFVPTFESIIQTRRKQAAKSLVVQVKSKYSAEELFLTCQSSLGPVDSLHFFSRADSKELSNFYIVEFQEESSIEKALYSKEGVQFFDYSRKEVDTFIPVRSPFTWLFGGGAKETERDSKSSNTIPNYIPVTFPLERPSVTELPSFLSDITSLELQILEFERLSNMLDISSRIRFLTCRQLELCLSGLFGTFVSILPFGSSVNSFGSCDSDLDMVINFSSLEKNDDSASQLYFHVKGGFGQRNMSQMYIRILANLLQDIVPGIRNVQSISNARVPILKYHHQLLNLECDLSASSLSGVFMSELLYLYGEMDSRVRPLVLVIRRWAKEYGLVTNTRPTKMFTNFTITLLVIFFLQHNHKILPSVDCLRELGDPKELKICSDGVKRDFLTDISGYQSYLNSQYSLNEDKPTLEALLKDFFDFYGDFDFKGATICINSGKIRGPGKDRLNIINPLEPHLNVSANVSLNSISSFQLYCKRTLALINANPCFNSLFRGRVSRNLNDLFQTMDSNKKSRK